MKKPVKTQKQIREAKKAAQREKFARGIDKFMGDEPRPENLNTSLDFQVARNWYNYTYSAKDAVPWIVEYMKRSNYTSAQISKFKKAPDWTAGITAGAIARMINNGARVPEESVNWLNSRIDETINKGLEKEEQSKDVSSPVTIRTKEKTDTVIADLEDEIDNFVKSKYKTEFKPYDFMRKNNVKSVQAKKIIDYYNPLIQELTFAVSGKDSQVKEAYNRLSKIEIKRYFEFITEIVKAAESVSQMAKAVRAPRKTSKPKSASQLVTKLKYLKESNQYKIASIDPSKIINSSILVIFNTKNRKLGYYVAADSTGLSVKGTTITGFDETKSVSKTLRKPEQILPTVLQNTKPMFMKTYSQINSTDSALNGRINDQIVLLKVY